MASNEPFYTGPSGPISTADGWIDNRASYVSMILADGPVGYWRLGEASGNVADSSGQGISLTAAGSITYGVSSAISPDPNTAVSTVQGAGFFNSSPSPNMPSGAAPFTFEA